ncbi:uncharacterized protein LAESUDRAFT_545485 [Laetiporus sulphureus 93-53]|uniref:Uncharacterized protein n=1 Tax=Laetiporus sulphureus 93-53 TaxID=1314785 RepID=A0A165FNU7_9APHY|nr:uncharacterized protein LAESUDRAFT_545485 [Laetiporus sulphureus 93-53]KZT09251.1 hypothetical protein LAESUDRAFT_545485 [Laetiporus sulphureus 93-53]
MRAKANNGMEARSHIVLKDITPVNKNVAKPSSIPRNTASAKEGLSDSVRLRMQECERERERLRAMQRDEEKKNVTEPESQRRERQIRRPEDNLLLQELFVRDEDEHVQAELVGAGDQSQQDSREIKGAQSLEYDADRAASTTCEDGLSTIGAVESAEGPGTSLSDKSTRDSSLSLLKQSLKLSLRRAIAPSKASMKALRLRDATSCLPSQPDNEVYSSLSNMRDAPKFAQSASTSHLDRMTSWIRSVEKVVEDARQKFAVYPNNAVPLLSLPIAPTSRRTSITRSAPLLRTPRNIPAVNTIFIHQQHEVHTTPLEQPSPTTASFCERANSVSVVYSTNDRCSTPPTSLPNSPCSIVAYQNDDLPESVPGRRRVASENLMSRPAFAGIHLDAYSDSLSKRRERSRSQNDLAAPITPVSKLELEIEKLATNPRPRRLSEVVDRNVFIASSSKAILQNSDTPHHVDSSNSLHPPATFRTDAANGHDDENPECSHASTVEERQPYHTWSIKDTSSPISRQSQQLVSPDATSKLTTPPPHSSGRCWGSGSAEHSISTMYPSNRNSVNLDTPGKKVAIMMRKAFKAITLGKSGVGMSAPTLPSDSDCFHTLSAHACYRCRGLVLFNAVCVLDCLDSPVLMLLSLRIRFPFTYKNDGRG